MYPRPPPQIGKVLVNTQMIAIEDKGDWMKVVVVPAEASPKDVEALWAKHVRQRTVADGKVPTADGEGEEEALWVLRQLGDMIYLVRDSFAVWSAQELTER